MQRGQVFSSEHSLPHWVVTYAQRASTQQQHDTAAFPLLLLFPADDDAYESLSRSLPAVCTAAARHGTPTTQHSAPQHSTSKRKSAGSLLLLFGT
jgi:hypothetical protein